MVAVRGEDPCEVDERCVLSPWPEGWRCLVLVDDRIRLRARGGRDLAPELPAIREAIAACRLPGSPTRPTILDGILIPASIDEIGTGGGIAASRLELVDVLCREGRDVTGSDVVSRQAELRGLGLLERDEVRVLATWRGDAGVALAQSARAGQAGSGGLLARRASSPYRPGVRSREWIVFRERWVEEFLLCGITGAGALVLGRTTSHGLAFAGLTWPSRVWSELAPRCREAAPSFAAPEIWPTLGPIAWARPELWVGVVADVRPNSGAGGPRWRFQRVQEDLTP
jgi:ATP-dependent DNA ligase